MADVEEGHVCKECGKIYNKKSRLEEHKRSHTGERPYKCEFEGCGKSFIRPYHLKRHLVIHTGQEPFKCTYPGCTQTFSLKHSLQRHERRSHNSPFKCHYDGCHQSFKKSSQLSRHICLIHTKESRFKCQVEGCNAGFNVASRLKRHMEKHSKGYICSIPGCSETFDKFSKLTVHMRSHGKQHSCEQCNKTFSHIWELKKHASVHNTNRKMYECPREGCSRVYSKAFNLRVHIKAFHEGNRPYLCTWEGCGKGFAHKVSLRQHLVLHSQRRIKPTPSPEEKALLKKKKKKRPSLAKQLSGYRSSLSESSDAHCTETAPKKRKTPNQAERNETESVMDIREANSVYARDGEVLQRESGTLENITEPTDLTSSIKDSVVATANEGRSEGMQVDASSTLVSPCTNSATTSTNQGLIRSEEVQGGVASVPSSNVVSAYDITATTTANQVTPENMHVVTSDASSSLLFSYSSSAADFADQGRSEERQGDVTLSASSTLVTSRTCNTSSTTTTCVDKMDRMQVEMASTPTSSNFQEQNPGTFADDHMFPSSDEDGEGMDWEPAVADTLEVHSPVECDLEPEIELENITDRCSKEDNRSDKRSSRKPAENSVTTLPPNIAEEVVSTALTTVSDGDSSEDDLPLSLLAKASSSVNKTKVSAKRSQKTKKKEGKRIRKSFDLSQSDGEDVEEVSSRSDEIVKVAPPAGLKACYSDIREGVDVLESTDFPDMDDVLQVIIEEEENELKSSCQNENVMVEERYIDDSTPGDASEERSSEIPREELDLGEKCEIDAYSRLEFVSQEQFSKDDGAMSDKDTLIVDNINDVLDDYENIGGDQEDRGSEQQKPAQDASSPNGCNARDKAIEQSCLRDSTRETPKVDEPRGLTPDQGGSKSQESDGTAENLCPTVEVTPNNNSVPKELPRSVCKNSRQRNKNNVGAKRSVNKSSSCTPSTAKCQGKNAHRVDRVNRDNSEVNDIGTEAEENSQTIEKPLKEELDQDVSKAKFRSRNNIFACDLQTLELLWNFKGR